MIIVIPFSGIPQPEINMSQLAIDLSTGDLAVPPYIVKGADAVIQKIHSRFRMFKGEWFLDRRIGVPFLEIVLIKNPDLLLINFIFSRVLLTTPGVASVESFSSSLDRPSRTLIADFRGSLVDGSAVIAKAQPFILG